MRTALRLAAVTVVCSAVWGHGVWTGAMVTPILLRQRAQKLAATRAPAITDIEF